MSFFCSKGWIHLHTRRLSRLKNQELCLVIEEMIRMVLQILIQTVTPASMIHLKLFIPSGTTSCWYLPYCSSLLVSAVSSFCSFLRLWLLLLLLLLLGGRIGQNDLRYLKSPKVYTNHPVVPAQTLTKWTPI